MELIVKVTREGISRIGIQYNQEYQAVKTYEELFLKQGGELFSLTVELCKDKLNLILISDSNGIKCYYKDITYSNEQLIKLMKALESQSNFQFLHVYSKNNTVLIAKPFRAQSFIILSKIEIINPVNI